MHHAIQILITIKHKFEYISESVITILLEYIFVSVLFRVLKLFLFISIYFNLSKVYKSTFAISVNVMLSFPVHKANVPSGTNLLT